MNAQTDDTGRVTRIFVTIYDSLEFMYGDLCLCLLYTSDVHVFRELAFEEAYITRYKEKMDANGYPMSILLTISTLRLDINKFEMCIRDRECCG